MITLFLYDRAVSTPSFLAVAYLIAVDRVSEDCDTDEGPVVTAQKSQNVTALILVLSVESYDHAWTT